MLTAPAPTVSAEPSRPSSYPFAATMTRLDTGSSPLFSVDTVRAIFDDTAALESPVITSTVIPSPESPPEMEGDTVVPTTEVFWMPRSFRASSTSPGTLSLATMSTGAKSCLARSFPARMSPMFPWSGSLTLSGTTTASTTPSGQKYRATSADVEYRVMPQSRTTSYFPDSSSSISVPTTAGPPIITTSLGPMRSSSSWVSEGIDPLSVNSTGKPDWTEAAAATMASG